MKISIRAKIIGSYALLFALTLTIGLVGIWVVSQVDKNYSSVIDQGIPLYSIVHQIKSGILEKGSTIQSFVISKDGLYITEFYDFDAKLVETIEAARAAFPDEESQKLLAEIEEANNDYNNLVTRVAYLDSNEAMTELTAGTSQLAATSEKLLADLAGLVSDANNRRIAYAKSVSRSSRLVSIIGVIVGASAAISIGVGLTRSIANTVVKVRTVAEAVADGDLTVSVPPIRTGDEIQELNDATQAMVHNLTSLLMEIRAESDNVADASLQLSTSAEASAQAVLQITSTIQQMSSSAEQQSSSSIRTVEASLHIKSGTAQIAAGAVEQTQQLHRASELVAQDRKSVV